VFSKACCHPWPWQHHPKELYARQGWQAEVEIHYKALAPLTKDAEPSAEDDDPRSAE
jgi:hypothetical protein